MLVESSGRAQRIKFTDPRTDIFDAHAGYTKECLCCCVRVGMKWWFVDRDFSPGLTGAGRLLLDWLVGVTTHVGTVVNVLTLLLITSSRDRYQSNPIPETV